MVLEHRIFFLYRTRNSCSTSDPVCSVPTAAGHLLSITGQPPSPVPVPAATTTARPGVTGRFSSIPCCWPPELVAPARFPLLVAGAHCPYSIPASSHWIPSPLLRFGHAPPDLVAPARIRACAAGSRPPGLIPAGVCQASGWGGSRSPRLHLGLTPAWLQRPGLAWAS
jgi:hypothetical protein